jgi:hypothetical protein
MTETSSPLQSYINQRYYLEPEVRRAVLRLEGASETLDQRNSSVSELTMAHAGPLPTIRETLHLLCLEEFTELLNGCASDA